jgi:mono/diheme cytochrome c family protein
MRLIASFLLLGLTLWSQTSIKQTPVPMTSPGSGKEMFEAYCAACHGPSGKGDGPAAAALKKAPSNLTELSRRNGGKFPELKVVSVIKGDSTMVSHGSRDMPVWGQVFSGTISHGNQDDIQMRISNLTSYVQSIQAK